jgi:hypothetical protein
MRFEYTRHAIQRMFEREIGPEEAERAVSDGQVIATYPDDKPYPSSFAVLVSDFIPLHVVFAAAENKEERIVYIITVYRPDPAEWDDKYSVREDVL